MLSDKEFWYFIFDLRKELYGELKYPHNNQSTEMIEELNIIDNCFKIKLGLYNGSDIYQLLKFLNEKGTLESYEAMMNIIEFIEDDNIKNHFTNYVISYVIDCSSVSILQLYYDKYENVIYNDLKDRLLSKIVVLNLTK